MDKRKDMDVIKIIKSTIAALGDAFPENWYREYIVSEAGTLEAGLIYRRIGFKIDTSAENTARENVLNIYKNMRDRFEQILPGALLEATLKEEKEGSAQFEYILIFMWEDECFEEDLNNNYKSIKVIRRVKDA